jgi:hypothetical protein
MGVEQNRLPARWKPVSIATVGTAFHRQSSSMNQTRTSGRFLRKQLRNGGKHHYLCRQRYDASYGKVSGIFSK